MATYTRASRDYEFVPGIGSNMTIKQYGTDGVPIENPVTFDIETGFIREIWKNKNTTHSGSNGGTLRTRVGADWLFGCVLSFPASINGLAAAFAEVLMGQSGSVYLQFNVGDPLFWPIFTEARNYRGKALLSTIEVRLDSTGEEVVGLNIAGEGNGQIETYLGNTQNSAQLWF